MKRFFPYYVGWMAGMVSAMIVFGISTFSRTERWRAAERGDGKFIVQTNYSRFFGDWHHGGGDRAYDHMEDAVKEVMARRAKATVVRVAK